MGEMTESLSASIATLQDMIQEAGIIAGFTGRGSRPRAASRLPVARQPMDAPQADPVRTLRAKRRGPAGGMAAQIRDGRSLSRCAPEPRPSRSRRARSNWPDAGRDHAEYRRPPSGIRPQDDQVIELHGNGTYARCLACGRRHELAWVRQCFDADEEPPDCIACGGILKSATISFGQAMPEEAMRRAQKLAARLRRVPCRGVVTDCLSGRGVPSLRQGKRSAADHRQPGADTPRSCGGSGDSCGNRSDLLKICHINSRTCRVMKISSPVKSRFRLPLIQDDVILLLRIGFMIRVWVIS